MGVRTATVTNASVRREKCSYRRRHFCVKGRSQAVATGVGRARPVATEPCLETTAAELSSGPSEDDEPAQRPPRDRAFPRFYGQSAAGRLKTVGHERLQVSSDEPNLVFDRGRTSRNAKRIESVVPLGSFSSVMCRLPGEESLDCTARRRRRRPGKAIDATARGIFSFDFSEQESRDYRFVDRRPRMCTCMYGMNKSFDGLELYK